MKISCKILLGYYHGIRYGRISLSLDVMEVYRPLLVDQWIIQLIRTNKLVKKDFHPLEEKGIYLTKEGRKKFMHLYQKWHQQIQYRKMIEEGVIGVRKAYMKGDVRILEKTYKKILHYLL